MTNLGAFVAVNFPILEGYIGYFPSAESIDSGTTSGSAFQVGVGYKIFPLVKINLEYLNSSYNKSDGSTTSGFSASSSLYIFSVSVPLNI